MERNIRKKGRNAIRAVASEVVGRCGHGRWTMTPKKEAAILLKRDAGGRMERAACGEALVICLVHQLWQASRLWLCSFRLDMEDANSENARMSTVAEALAVKLSSAHLSSSCTLTPFTQRPWRESYALDEGSGDPLEAGRRGGWNGRHAVKRWLSDWSMTVAGITTLALLV